MRYLISYRGKILKTGDCHDVTGAIAQADLHDGNVTVWSHSDVGLIDDEKLRVVGNKLAKVEGVEEDVQGDGLSLIKLVG